MGCGGESAAVQPMTVDPCGVRYRHDSDFSVEHAVEDVVAKFVKLLAMNKDGPLPGGRSSRQKCFT